MKTQAKINNFWNEVSELQYKHNQLLNEFSNNLEIQSNIIFWIPKINEATSITFF